MCVHGIARVAHGVRLFHGDGGASGRLLVYRRHVCLRMRHVCVCKCVRVYVYACLFHASSIYSCVGVCARVRMCACSGVCLRQCVNMYVMCVCGFACLVSVLYCASSCAFDDCAWCVQDMCVPM